MNLIDFCGGFCKNEWKKSLQYGMLEIERNVVAQSKRSLGGDFEVSRLPGSLSL